MSWELIVGLGGAVTLALGIIGFAWYAMRGLRDAQERIARAQTAVDAGRKEIDVERRLRKQAEGERDAALADAAHQKLIVVTNRAAAKMAIEQLDELAVKELKGKIDAITDGTLAAADAELDAFLGMRK